MAEEEERYILQEAADKLGVSRRTLVSWLDDDGLRETVDKQVWETDARARYLTKTQLVRMAKRHRRTLKSEGSNAQPMSAGVISAGQLIELIEGRRKPEDESEEALLRYFEALNRKKERELSEE